MTDDRRLVDHLPGGASSERRRLPLGRRRCGQRLRRLIGRSGLLTGAEGGGSPSRTLGFCRGRYDSPSTTRSKAAFLNRSTALCASRTSSNVASHSLVSRLLVTIVAARA